MTYETQTMTHTQAHDFCRRFDLEIQTERELNSSGNDDGKYYVFCSDLDSMGEVNACRKFEESALRI